MTTQHSIIQIFLQIVQFVKTGMSYLVLPFQLKQLKFWLLSLSRRELKSVHKKLLYCFCFLLQKTFNPEKIPTEEFTTFNNSATRSTCKNLHLWMWIFKFHLWRWGQIWSFWSFYGQVCQEETWKKGSKRSFYLISLQEMPTEELATFQQFSY